MIILRILLLPLTLLYGLIILLRNALYKYKIMPRTQFDFPIICIGNIAVGGTGKTPHIEWLIRQFQHEYNLAVLSRGYKRKTVGFILADEHATVDSIGDEPFQLHQKFSNLTVAVSENRVLGIPNLLGNAPQTQVVLMDDGFQHLPILTGLTIILTDYANLFTTDWLMPSGTLREFKSAYKRAQVIVVTKCPSSILPHEQQLIIQQINPLPHQTVLFSCIIYGELVPVFKNQTSFLQNNVLAFSGIAKNTLFINELKQRYSKVESISFSDHQDYTNIVLSDIASRYRSIADPNCCIITTEKDAVKLQTQTAQNILGELPVFYMPIEIQFLQDDGQKLKTIVTQFIGEFDIADEGLMQ